MEKNTPNKKELSDLKKIELLNLLKAFEFNNRSVATQMGINIKLVQHYRRKLPARTIEDTNRAIYKLEKRLYGEEIDVLEYYKKQEICTHEKMTLHCTKCNLWISEQDLDKMIEHIEKHRMNHQVKYLTVQPI